MVVYKIGIENLDWEQLFNLYKKVGLLSRFINNKDFDSVEKAFTNSYKVVTAWDKEKLVGACRLISDGISYGMAFDLGILPEYQKMGLGKGILLELLKGTEKFPVHLTSTFGNEEFYKKLGFKKHKTAYSKYPFKTDYVED